jgi:hypothetical protein
MKQSKSCATATASLFPNKLLNLAGDQGYSDEDLWNDYAHSAEDFVKHPSVKVVDVSKSNAQDLMEARTQWNTPRLRYPMRSSS